MSFHNKETYPEYNTDVLRAELSLHGMCIDSPSQLSNAFRFGWLARKRDKPRKELISDLKAHIKLDLSNRSVCEDMLKILEGE